MAIARSRRRMELPCCSDYCAPGSDKVMKDLKNRDVFARDPTSWSIPNLGVTKVGPPQTPEEWEVVRYELENFVCEGEYEKGLERVLSSFLGNIGKAEQPAVWVSGFYGSGK